MKRFVPLLVLGLLFIAVAPSAMAYHCQRCASVPTPHCTDAIRVYGYECFSDGVTCTVFGEQCDPHQAMGSLASEYSVASVERLDEPAAEVDKKLVASASTPRPTTR